MKRIGLVFIFIICVVTAREIDFDALEKNTKNKRSISMGFNDASKANNKKFQKINNGQRKTVNKFMSSMSSGASTTTSGSHAYQCSYHCRTDGILANSTKTFHVSIKANTRYEAEDKLKNISSKHCRSKYAEGTFGKKWMWSTSIRCE